MNSFYHQNLWLCEHPVFQYLTQQPHFDQSNNDEILFIVERPCDVFALQEYVQSAFPAHKFSIVNAENLALELLSPPDIHQCDVQQKTEQRNITLEEQYFLLRLILIEMGYSGTDAEFVVQDLWPFFNLIWPKDISFLEILIDKNSTRPQRISHLTPEVALRTILALFQITGLIVSSFVRIQNLHDRQICERLIHYWKSQGHSLLNAPQIIWWHAPKIEFNNNSYQMNSSSIFHFENDEFSRISPDSTLCQILFETVQILNPNIKSARTNLPINDATPTKFEVKIHQTAQEFWNFEKNTLKTFHLDYSHWTRHNSFGSGLIPLNSTLLTRFIEKQAPLTKTEQEIQTFLKSLETKWKKTNLLIKSFQTERKEILTQYGIQIQSKSRQLPHWATDALAKSHFIGSRPPLAKHNCISHFRSNLLRQNSLNIAGHFYPMKTIPLSAPRKLLRDTLSAARHLPLELDSEISSKNLLLAIIQSEQQLNIDHSLLTLHFASKEDYQKSCEKYDFLSVNSSLQTGNSNFNSSSCSNSGANFSSNSNQNCNVEAKTMFPKNWFPNAQESLIVSDWCQRHNWPVSPNGLPKIGVTAFELYLQCPLKFYWNQVLKAENDPRKPDEADSRDIGIRVHSIAEILLTRLNAAYGSQNLKLALPALQNLLISFQNEEFFLSSSKDLWIKHLSEIVRNSNKQEFGILHNSTLFIDSQKQWEQCIVEICSQIFNEDTSYSGTIASEIVKRSFLRLLSSETERLNSEEICHITAFTEQPVSFEMGGLLLSGRIDRVDSDNNGSFHIIDYKTSRIPKQDKQLGLFPSSKATPFSVQAALYTYAWCLKDQGKVTKFSLYRLKNLNPELSPYLSISFETPLDKHSPLFEAIKNTYTPIAQQLKDGDFSPKPLRPDLCQSCRHALQCPRAFTEISKITNDIPDFEGEDSQQ